MMDILKRHFEKLMKRH